MSAINGCSLSCACGISYQKKVGYFSQNHTATVAVGLVKLIAIGVCNINYTDKGGHEVCQ